MVPGTHLTLEDEGRNSALSVSARLLNSRKINNQFDIPSYCVTLDKTWAL